MTQRDLIRAVLELRGMSMATLCKRTGITKRRLRGRLRRETMMGLSIRDTVAICKALDIGADVFVKCFSEAEAGELTEDSFFDLLTPYPS